MVIPAAIIEALSQLRRHPALLSVQDPVVLQNGNHWIEMEVPVPLPSRAVAQGFSATGVRAMEPLTLVFKADFPLSAPYPLLRVDFPVNMPHINMHRPGQHVSPCVYEGKLDELFHMEGLAGVVEQACDWLAKAASGQLINLSQGWEPMRHDDCDGTIQFDADLAVDRLPKDGSILFAPSKFAVTNAGRFFSADLSQASAAITYFGEEPGQRIQSGKTSALFVQAQWADELPAIHSEYSPDTVVDFPTLLALAGRLGIDVNLLREGIESAHNGSRLMDTSPWRSFQLAVVLAVHRPVALIGARGRKVELLPYLLSLKVDAKNAGEIPSASVRFAYHLHQLSANLLARTSGTPVEALGRRVTFLGCGSLGSKVAFHLGRAGFGQCSFVDNEVFSPHNTARHALLELPNALYSEKALQMRRSFASMGHALTRASTEDLVKLFTTDAGAQSFKELADGSSLVLDTTASRSVAQAAVSTNVLGAEGSRFARGMLYGRGRASVLMLEGPTRQPRVDDLEAALFSECRFNSPLREAISAGDGEGRELFVGDSCRSLTMVMPDSVVSRGAAQISMQLEKWLAGDFPSSGCLGIGYSDSDASSTIWKVVNLDATTVLASSGESGWTVRIAAAVVNSIRVESVHWGERETGGVLLGKIDAFTKTITIADLVPAPLDSVREPAKFVLGVEGLLNACRTAHADSLGYLGYLGTWHSHPMGGSHSALDFQTLDQLAAQAVGEPRVSLVWTPSELVCAVHRREPK